MVSSIHRPTQAIVDLSALSDNIQMIQQHLPKATQTYAVVKANAYGHGAVRVAHHIQNQVDGFCVSNLDEGLELRAAGIEQPILVLGVLMPEEIPLAIAYNITITVASLEWIGAAGSYSLDGLSVHLKVDTGMGRIGFCQAMETQKALESLKSKGAIVEGIFTHFATADEKDDTYFLKQLENFKAHLAHLDELPPIIHASNSATSLWHSEGIFNAVRLGIAMYGLNPSGQELPLPYPLKPTLCLRTEIIHVKQLQAGEKIGYGATYETSTSEIIATLPIGYADGWTRDMQHFKVLVEGHFCPIVGRVSMDQITIRLPRSYPLGTEVILIGENESKAITVTDIAQHRGTINYEVLCLLSERIPRTYS